MSTSTPLTVALLLAVSGSLMANEHVAGIDQHGTDNIAEQVQSGVLLRSFIRQDGTANRALTDQSGISADDRQTSIEQAGTSNFAAVYQIYGSQPGVASADIYQVGDANSARVDQLVYTRDLAAGATVRQEGTANQLDARQTWVGNQLNVLSVGQDNAVRVDQTGFSTAMIQQAGTANLVQIDQHSSGIGGGFAVVSQEGTANQADVLQSSGRYPAGDVFLQQVGTANIAQVRSSDGHSTLDYMQRGTGNELRASFVGHGSSIDGYSDGSYNLVEITQFGDDNDLDIAQLGSHNQIDAYQGFNAHDALISQSGDSNRAFLRQESVSLVGHSASIYQNGNGNIATVNQQ